MAKDDKYEEIVKIATQAIEQCRAYEEKIKSLQAQSNISKSAGLDEKLLKETVSALSKHGRIKPEQEAEVSALLKKDANASLRTIKALCGDENAPNIMKAGAVNLEGGTLVKENAGQASKPTDRDLAYQAVAETLGLKI